MNTTARTAHSVVTGASPVPAPADRGEPVMQLITGADEFLSIGAAWDRLALGDPASTIFQSHTWLRLWWKYFSRKSDRLAVMLFSVDGALIGAAPLFLRTWRVAGWPVQHQLRLIGSGELSGNSFGMFLDDGPSDYLNILALPGWSAVVVSMIERAILDGTVPCDRLELLNIPEGSPLRGLFRSDARAGEYAGSSTGADICPYLPAPAGKEEFLRSLSPGIRRKFSQLSRSLGTDGIFRIRSAASRPEAGKILEYLIGLHQRRWNRLGYPGLFAKPHFAEFFRDLCGELFDRGELWCRVTENDSGVFGARIAFRFNGIYFDYLSGFDDHSAMTKHRPGFALLSGMIDDAIAGGAREINFLRGDEAYKFELTSAFRRNLNLTLTARAYHGTVRHALWLVAGCWRFLLTMIARERDLLLVQFRINPVHLFLLRYISFRAPKFAKKFSRAVKSEIPRNEEQSR